MARLFGTDGVRGVANTELTAELAVNIGRAASTVLTQHLPHAPKILIGKDPRLSSDMLECALVAGICSVGADAVIIGTVPTPAVAYLVKKYKADAGIMISASHNSAEFNGIKIFNSQGFKLDDSLEEEIEALILDTPEKIFKVAGDEVGQLIRNKTACEDYIAHVKSVTTGDLTGLKIAIDCANGSSSVTAEKLFTELGAECHMLSYLPDGVNINLNCGSTHMDNLVKYVIENECDVGVAFDGDADRCLMVDENGDIVDGDMIIAIASKSLKDAGKLKNNTAVVTVMSNLGFFKFATENDIDTAITKVGDRYVLEEMQKSGHIIGGEQSGHIIFLEHCTTGDGQMTAAMILAGKKATGKPMSELAAIMDVYPQILVNIKTTNEGKAKFEADAQIMEYIKEAEKVLEGDGRVLVRVSGTEPLVRVMVEGKDQAEINKLAYSIADEIKRRID